MKTLYFDIDGTLLARSAAKPMLADGAFERAVREAGFERLVCVSQLCASIRGMGALRPDMDEHAMLMDVCRGTFADPDWFRQAVRLTDNPELRVGGIDMEGDWWYADDLADRFFSSEGRQDEYREHLGIRVYQARTYGDGTGILDWLKNSASS
jgi:hypothetical protein